MKFIPTLRNSVRILIIGFLKNIYVIKIHHFGYKEIFHADMSVVTAV